MMAGLLDCPEEVSFNSSNSVSKNYGVQFGYIFDEELLRWIAEAEYLGVSRETAILIATKRRALSLNRSAMNITSNLCDNKDSVSSVGSLSQINAPVDAEAYINNNLVKNVTQYIEHCKEDCTQKHLHLSQTEMIHAKNCSTQASSTQETIVTRSDAIERFNFPETIRTDGLLDQIINSTIGTINNEHKKKKRRNKRRKRNAHKNLLISTYNTCQNNGGTDVSNTNAILLSSILEKDSNNKLMSEDNNSSIDTTMGIVNSGLDQVDCLNNCCSSLDAVVAAHSNNPFNNHRSNIKLRRKRRSRTRNNSSVNNNRSDSLSRRAGNNFGEFAEPSRININNAKRNSNRNRKKTLLPVDSNLNPTNIAPVVTETKHPQNLRYRSTRNFGGSDRGRTRPRKSEAVEYVREQLRITYRSRGVLEI